MEFELDAPTKENLNIRIFSALYQKLHKGMPVFHQLHEDSPQLTERDSSC